MTHDIFSTSVLNNNTSPSTSSKNCEAVFDSSALIVNSLFIVHQNIRSLRKNFDALACHFDGFVLSPHFVFLSETWIYGVETDDFMLPGYNFYALCNDDYPSGGVAVFVKSDYNCFVTKFNVPSADILQLECVISNVNFVFLCVYRFHDRSVSKESFCKDCFDIIGKIKSTNLIVLGDMNLDLLVSSPIVDNYLFQMASFGLLSAINKPTRISSGKCLDHIFIRTIMNLNSAFDSAIFDFKISDHCMTGILFSNFLVPIKIAHVPNSVRTVINFIKLKLLQREFWEDVYIETNPSVAYDKFLHTLNKHILACTFQQTCNSTAKTKRLQLDCQN